MPKVIDDFGTLLSFARPLLIFWLFLRWTALLVPGVLVIAALQTGRG
jgi:hypothetical protein